MRYIVIALGCCALNGCVLLVEGATAWKMNTIEIGMPKEDVLAQLGEPISKGADQSSVTWYYMFYDTGRDSLNGISTTYFVRLVDDRVDTFGRSNEALTDYKRVKAQSCPPPPLPPPPTICPPPPIQTPCICPSH